MKAEMPFQACNAVPLEHILNSVVVVNWNTLGLGSAVTGIRVEYHIGKEGSVESLKLWACRSEYWSLICDCSPHFGWSDGPRFAHGYHSRQLGRLLQSILLNQKLFSHDCGPNANWTLEVRPPTVDEVANATLQVSEAFSRG
jgi:hypothetical protein